jgi:hypothetical protein
MSGTVSVFELTFRWNAAMPIYSVKDGVFDPEATALMGEAFDAACRELHFPRDKWARELIAKRIIVAARKGERDPVRLRAAALVGLSHRMVLSSASRYRPTPVRLPADARNVARSRVKRLHAPHCAR